MKKVKEAIKGDTNAMNPIKKANKNKKEKTNYNKPFKLEMSFDEAVERAGKIKIGKKGV